MHKFYVGEFVNKVHKMPDPDKVFIKFGITHHWDVMDRFNPLVDDGYSKNYKDWVITCKFSHPYLSKEDAEQQENHWLNKQFPRNSQYKVWVENYLKIKNNTYYKDNTGITELRLLSLKQAKWVYYKLHSEKKVASQ